MSHYRWDGDDLLLHCHLQPGARREGFAGLHGDRLKIRISAPPVEGRANERLIAWLAEQFGVPQRAVTLERGDTSRQKSVRIAQPAQLPAEAGIAPR